MTHSIQSSVRQRIHIFPAAVMVLLSIMAISYTYMIDQRYLNRPFPKLTTQALPSAKNRAASPQLAPLSDIRTLTLMGRVPLPEEAVASLTLEDIPDTQLNLVLIGVFASESAEVAAALIRVNGGHPHYYRVGQEVVDGTTLEIVATDGVTLRSGNAYEKLMFAHSKIWTQQSSISLAELKVKHSTHTNSNVPNASISGHTPSTTLSTDLVTAIPPPNQNAEAHPLISSKHLTLRERLQRLRANMPVPR